MITDWKLYLLGLRHFLERSFLWGPAILLHVSMEDM